MGRSFRQSRPIRDRRVGNTFRHAWEAAAVLAAVMISGCGVLDPDVPRPELDIPPGYLKQDIASTRRAPASSADFTMFRSKRLIALLEAARGFNLDTGAAIARIQQAEAQVRIATQPLIPLIQAGGTASRSLSQGTGNGASLITGGSGGNAGGTGTGGTGTAGTGGTGTVLATGRTGGPVRRTSFNAQLTASYEIDFWGRNQAALLSAEANEFAASFDAATVAISTDANVANTFFQAIATREQITIARKNLATATRTLDAVLARQKVGTASGLDVAQQETLANTIRATIPPLERTLQQSAHALAVLTGTAPEFFAFQGENLFAIRVPKVEAGLPSDLLYRRPDIAFAEAQLAAARFTVSSARAALFPSIQLTGTGGFTSAALDTLFQPQSAFYNMALGIAQPLTNLYQLQAQIDFDKARYGELLLNYRRVIVAAFQDVEDALSAYGNNAEQERLQTMAVMSARRAFEITEAQLRGGVIDLITVLQVETALFNAENSLALVRLSRLQAAVSLYRALGGGWQKPLDAGIAAVPAVAEIRQSR